MTRRQVDWLDVMARRVVVAERVVSREADTTSFSSDEHFSRATAVKYGAAAVASLSLGLWRVPEGQALDEAGCIDQCFNRRVREAEQADQACRRLYSPGWYSKPGTDSRWGVFKELVKSGGPWGWAKAYADQVLLNGCLIQADSKLRKGLDNCEDACRVACETSRFLQGRSSRHQVCKPPPAPKPESPKPPPAPDRTEDPCWSCVAVGGACCGPFKGDPNTGSFTPCLCANPTIGCKASGCG